MSRPAPNVHRRGSAADGARLALALIAALAPVRAAHAWADEGHQVIGLIAEHFLEPAVRARVLALLASDASGLVPDRGIAAESTWADRFRDSDRDTTGIRYRATRRWHFIDLELGAPGLDAACFGHPPVPPGTLATAGPADDCIVDKIIEFRAELASRGTPPAERLEALQFLLHLVGDVHQPLHASDDRDQGGNGRRVEAADGFRGTLHQLWDVEVVRRLGSDRRALAAALIGELSAAEQRRLGGGTPGSWALESYAVAREAAYGGLPPPDPDGRYRLPEAYLEAATRAARVQLERAGLRLAALLNDALR